ncbi:MAG: DUF3604 domain-containing protein [bacterium]|nr:hypothetical protein [Deltaproteobacteria bacterium]MCP4906950.1 DUF3604 domain-containing protein [bacterium]
MRLDPFQTRSLSRTIGVATLVGVCTIAFFLAAVGAAATATDRPYAITEEREACRDYDPLRRPFFGDTHVHTSYSHDASTQDTRNTPRDAYRFARGEEIGIQPYGEDGIAKRRVKLDRPLDWTAISDHAEMLGEVRICHDSEHSEYDSDVCWNKRNARFALLGFLARSQVGERHKMCGPGGELCYAAARSAWADIQAAAEAAYDRSAACQFTSVIGYEWTSSIASNLHRNVLFRNHVVPDYALSSMDTISAFRLFEGLERGCLERLETCDAVVIPHNSNISMDGYMFKTTRLTSLETGKAKVDREEARLRNRFERVVEIMQHKGDSECLLGAETTDEACGFEKLPYDAMSGAIGAPRTPPKRSAMVREALKKGLLLEEELGTNPLKFGIIASTDTHLGTPGLVAEEGHVGHGGASRVMQPALPQGLPDAIEFNPGGLAVVWAEENARDSIFEALSRREVYGTSGTRPEVRFFGGWNYPEDLCEVGNIAEQGYALGVPMGADLPARPAGVDDPLAPAFVVSALQDPGTARRPGTALQRIQIVKGWTRDGEAHERVYDVAGHANEASVDLDSCTPKGAGARSLCAVWRDPEFDAGERAFYYVRVLENPTCRWQQHLCVEAKVDCADPATVGPGYGLCCDSSVARTVQERAWTSPIWYGP